MSETLAKTVCWLHPGRPATARCPSCRRFFCVECITEHGGTWICASCLGTLSAEKIRGRRRRRYPLAAFLHSLLALGIVWALLYSLASFLAKLPDEFHDGTLWE